MKRSNEFLVRNLEQLGFNSELDTLNSELKRGGGDMLWIMYHPGRGKELRVKNEELRVKSEKLKSEIK
jgi:hypothetical protein